MQAPAYNKNIFSPIKKRLIYIVISFVEHGDKNCPSIVKGRLVIRFFRKLFKEARITLNKMLQHSFAVIKKLLICKMAKIILFWSSSRIPKGLNIRYL